MMLSEVLGQPRVVRSLSRALASERIHHALLFVGPRGVGKRTTAEALAHRLLCSAPHGTDPCRQCGACTRFSTGNHADFIMIGARKKIHRAGMRNQSRSTRSAPPNQT